MKKERVRRISAVCAQCGNAFAARVYSHATGAIVAKFCSRACCSASHNRQIERECCVCGASVRRSPSALTVSQVFCSQGCRISRVECICQACGKGFSRKRSHANRVTTPYCSEACRKPTLGRLGRIHGMSGTREYGRLQAHKRKVNKLRNGGTFTWREIETLLQRQRGRCYWRGESLKRGFHIDHRIPLNHGGHNNISNIVLACPKCNIAKSDLAPEIFARKIGLLVA